MQNQENFSLIFSQISQNFSSAATKTMSLELINTKKYMTHEQFLMTLKQMSNEIPILKTILGHPKLFTLIPLQNYIISQNTFKYDLKKFQKIGDGGNAQVFIAIDYLSNNKKIAIKVMNDVDEYRQESYLQECINHCRLQIINQNLILNIENLVFINFLNNKATFQSPIELAEFSLYDYIQENQITEETYQYFFNLLIDILILLHENKFAHRDIKPQNILFVKNQGWKLADFGESIQYQERIGVYKIQGTIAFLPRDVRREVYKKKEIVQDLFYNDVYAVVCTLILIKNPQFKSNELIEQIQISNLDKYCQQLLLISHSDQLKSLKFDVQGLKIQKFDIDSKQCDQMEQFDLVYNLRVLFHNQLPLENKLLEFIDQELFKLKNNDILGYNKLIVFLLILHPFQVEQLKQFSYQSKLDIYETLIQNQSSFSFDILVFQIIQSQKFELLGYLMGILIQKLNQQSIKCLLNIIIQLKKLDSDLKFIKKLLEKIGVKQNLINDMIQINENQIDSATLFFYNQCYLQIEQLQYDLIIQQEPQVDQNDFTEKEPIRQDSHNNLDKLEEFDYDGYVMQKKNDLPVQSAINLILLFHPLNNFKLDQLTHDKVMIYIIEQLKYKAEGNFKLSEIIKFHLIIGGSQHYMPQFKFVISGVIKFFIYYDLFQDLINLLDYFYSFMQFLGSKYALFLLLKINRIKFKLNIQQSMNNFKLQIYTITNKTLQYHLSDFAHSFNLAIQYNQMQEFNNTKEQLENPIEQGNCFISQLSKLMIKNVQFIFQSEYLIQAIIYIVETLEDQRFLEQNYLRILILILEKYLQAKNIDNYFAPSKFNTGYIRLRYSHILFYFYFQCKQQKRITMLLKEWQQCPKKLILYDKQIEQISKIQLMKQNLHLNIEKSYFIQLILKFTTDQRQRYLFNYKQHLYAVKVFPSLKKRIKIDHLNLREQYLSLI